MMQQMALGVVIGRAVPQLKSGRLKNDAKSHLVAAPWINKRNEVEKVSNFLLVVSSAKAAYTFYNIIKYPSRLKNVKNGKLRNPVFISRDKLEFWCTERIRREKNLMVQERCQNLKKFWRIKKLKISNVFVRTYNDNLERSNWFRQKASYFLFRTEQGKSTL